MPTVYHVDAHTPPGNQEANELACVRLWKMCQRKTSPPGYRGNGTSRTTVLRGTGETWGHHCVTKTSQMSANNAQPMLGMTVTFAKRHWTGSKGADRVLGSLACLWWLPFCSDACGR